MLIDQPSASTSREVQISLSGTRKSRPAVQIDGVAKCFGDTRALDTTWLKVADGEFLTLLGPSGCGKTTLLNLMAGFLEADEGEIFIGGSLVTDMPPHEREIGIVFQNYALFPHMNVARNIGYGLRMRGVSKDEIDRRVAEALALVKLENKGDQRPAQLSGGQQQRVALARALVIRPKVLLLDEPFSALDRNLRAAMQVELKEIQRSLGVTTVFVTHDQGEALSMSDRIAVMSAGRIRQIAAPDVIYRSPTDSFVAGFVGDSNFFPCEAENTGAGTCTVRLGGKTYGAFPARDLQAGPAMLFARPEQITLEKSGTADTLSARVTSHVYQGGYVDLYLECADAEGGRVLVRSADPAAMGRWPLGGEVALRLPAEGLVAFPKEGEGA